MKKSKIKSLIKSARKTAKKDIRLSLVAGLKEIAGKYGESSNKLEKDIKKGSKQLAKVLAKDIKISKSAVQETGSEAIAAEAAESQKTAIPQIKTSSNDQVIPSDGPETEA